MRRLSLRIVGAQGQGVFSVGDICAKGLKREGYCVLGYREYMSLIKGGHSSYQLDIDTVTVRSPTKTVKAVLTFNYQGLTRYFDDLSDEGYLIHDVPDWKFGEADQKRLEEKNIRVIYVPTGEILKELDAPLVMQNVIFSSVLWKALGQEKEVLKEMVREQFATKPKLIDLNLACVDRSFDFEPAEGGAMTLSLPGPVDAFKNHLQITGNEAAALGAVHAGVRFYAGYPMTPSSSLLGAIAKWQNSSGMIVKQAEDEITAAQMASGAYFMGTRAMTATSGGGFDLMTETVSMLGMVECPMVFVLAQRPGPATGVPTWTTQGDLFLAIHSAHGEFPRCVMGISDSDDAFSLIGVAHNIAEKYQIPVIVLTDKYTAECLFCVPPYDTESYALDRGALVTDEKELAELKPEDRFRVTGSGISKRWVPGQKAAGYCANSDEHTEDGTVTEESEPVKAMMEKRMRKLEALREGLPEPELFGAEDPEVLIVGWGSTRCVVLDVLEVLKVGNVGYLHYTYLWPLKTERFNELTKKAKRVILIETNYTGQLGFFLEQATGYTFKEKMLKYDGRPFFYEEVRDAILSPVPA